MKRVIITLILIYTLGIAGCTEIPGITKEAPCRVVTEILIHVEDAPEPGQCHYTDPAKMIKTLNCIRRLDPWDLPEADPEQAPGPRYRITLIFSDGSFKKCDLIGSSYYREGEGPWRIVSSHHALRFPLLLAAVPSDTI